MSNEKNQRAARRALVSTIRKRKSVSFPEGNFTQLANRCGVRCGKTAMRDAFIDLESKGKIKATSVGDNTKVELAA